MADLVINLKMAGEQVVIGGLRRVGEVAMNALGAALGQVADFAADSFKGAIEAQKGIDALSASITRLGGKAPVTMAGAEALADEFKNLVGGSDDAVLAMVNMGLRFDKIGKDTLPNFIKQSADLATVLKVDPVKAAEILGKSLQDLSVDGVGSIGRLKAAGVAFTDDQEKLIKKLVESGDVAGAQKVLLDALAKTTGGAAAAAAGTFEGQMAILKETIADAGEGVALKLLPYLTELAKTILPPLTEFITRLGSQLGIVAGVIASGNFAALFTAFEDGSSYLGSFLELLGMTEEQANATAAKFFDFAGSFAVVNGATLQLTKAFQASWPMIQAAVSDALTYVQGLIATIMPTIIDNVAQALNSLREFWTAHGAEIMAVVDFAFKVIAATIGTTLTLITGIIAAALQLLNGDWSGAWQTIQDTLGTALTGILAIVGVKTSEFLATWTGVFAQLLTIIQAGLGNAITAAQQMIQGFIDVGKAIAQGIADGISAGIGWLVDAAKGAAQAALNAAKHILGISSPSKVFAGIGQNMMLGMAEGITANAGLPAYATASAAAGTTISVGAINVNGANMTNAGVGAAVRAELERMGRQADTRIRTR